MSLPTILLSFFFLFLFDESCRKAFKTSGAPVYYLFSADAKEKAGHISGTPLGTKVLLIVNRTF